MERISFTRPSAERIARAVRVVENARPEGEALRARRIAEFTKARTFRIATYTGAWQVGATKSVTFKYKTSTPNTASVTNLFFPITRSLQTPSDCAIAKEGTAWYLIDVQFYTATAVFVTGTARQTHVTDISFGATLNTSSCSVSVGRTLTTASSIFVTGTVTSTFLRLEP